MLVNIAQRSSSAAARRRRVRRLQRRVRAMQGDKRCGEKGKCQSPKARLGNCFEPRRFCHGDNGAVKGGSIGPILLQRFKLEEQPNRSSCVGKALQRVREARSCNNAAEGTTTARDFGDGLHRSNAEAQVSSGSAASGTSPGAPC